jgi:hypothetical protein
MREEHEANMGNRHCGRDTLLILGLSLTGMTSRGDDLPMRVEIKLAQLAVRNNEEFSVSTVVRNISGGAQSLQVWSCSYSEQWTPDNSAIRLTPAACKKNDIVQVRLGPGEVYQRTLSARIRLAEPRIPGPVTFRLEFRPGGSEKTGVSLWSNAITAEVEE